METFELNKKTFKGLCEKYNVDIDYAIHMIPNSKQGLKILKKNDTYKIQLESSNVNCNPYFILNLINKHVAAAPVKSRVHEIFKVKHTDLTTWIEQKDKVFLLSLLIWQFLEKRPEIDIFYYKLKHNKDNPQYYTLNETEQNDKLVFERLQMFLKGKSKLKSVKLDFGTRSSLLLKKSSYSDLLSTLEDTAFEYFLGKLSFKVDDNIYIYCEGNYQAHSGFVAEYSKNITSFLINEFPTEGAHFINGILFAEVFRVLHKENVYNKISSADYYQYLSESLRKTEGKKFGYLDVTFKSLMKSVANNTPER